MNASRRDDEGERPRMLRIEVHGLLHDWFDLDDLGDMVKSSGFNITLRENIARYFGVPVDQQALYDEDGILATTADLRLALGLQGIPSRLSYCDRGVSHRTPHFLFVLRVGSKAPINDPATTSLAAKGYLDRALPGLSPKTGSWVQFFYMLWSPKTGVRGVFVDSRYNPSAEGKEFSIDLIADYSLWFVFWLVGSLVQLRTEHDQLIVF
eukprot:g5113.t1